MGRPGLDEPAAMAAATSIVRAQQLVLAAVDGALRPLGLTFARYEALVLLAFTRSGSLPLGKMGERLMVHPTSVTGIVDRLEADGLVRRVVHGDDRRITLVRDHRRRARARPAGPRRPSWRPVRPGTAVGPPARPAHDDAAHAPPRDGGLRAAGVVCAPMALPDRNLALELVRVTEAAAMAASRWMGRGDKNGADGAAVDAMRTILDTVPMDGIVVIGEGEKDEAPMLYNGERVGDGSAPEVDIAVDPVEGTTLTALGRGNAISVIAMSERGTMFDPGPCVYMEKIAVGPEAAGVVDITRTPTQNLKAVAQAKGESIRDVTAVILDRPRHEELIAEVRAAGARIRLIQDGDVIGAVSTALPDTGADILLGIGGTPEGVIAAAAMKCMGGEIQGRLWPRDEEERAAAIAAGYDLDRVLVHRRSRERRQRLLLPHRHHRRRGAQGRPLRLTGRHDAVARDAVAVGHGADGERPAPPPEAARLLRHRLRMTELECRVAFPQRPHSRTACGQDGWSRPQRRRTARSAAPKNRASTRMPITRITIMTDSRPAPSLSCR